MQIERLELHNFGLYRGRNEFDLTTSKSKPIVLICGLNGRGKTTFLDAIKLCLYGKFARCSNRNGIAYDEYLASCIHRGVRPTDGASIRIDMALANERAGKLSITRSWTEKKKTVVEDLRVDVDGHYDPALSEHWHRFFHEVLPVEVSQLFFFDGEQVQQIADKSSARETIRLGIKALLGIDLVDQLDKDLGTVVRTRAKSKTVDDGLRDRVARLEHDRKIIESQCQSITRKRGELATQKQRELNRLERLRQQFAELGGDLLANRDAIHQQIELLKAARHSLRSQLIELSAGPLPLYILRNKIRRLQKIALAKSQHDESQTVAAAVQKRDEEFLEILRNLKVSETERDKVASALRDSRADANTTEGAEYRFDTDAVLNYSTAALARDRKTAVKLIKAIQESTEQIDQLQSQLADVPSEGDVAEIFSSIKEAEAQVISLTTKLDALTDEHRELSTRERQASARLDVASKDVVVQSMADKQEAKAASRVAVIRDALARFRARAVEDALSDLGTCILEGFRQITGKVGLIQKVVISREDFSLELIDNQGRQFASERLSAGERQLLATSVLWGLARVSGLAVPLVVDTPLGRLDGVHRGLLLKNYYPVASHQVIVLSTDEEIDEARYEMLRQRVNRAYSLQYDEDLGCTLVSDGYGNWLPSGMEKESAQ